MKYMLLVSSTAEEFDVRDNHPDDMAERFAFMAKVIADLTASGEFVDGAGLAAPRVAKTVRPAGAGAIVTDGPFAEAKEVLGGYFILDCATEKRAVEIAEHIVTGGGLNALEVRPFEPEQAPEPDGR